MAICLLPPVLVNRIAHRRGHPAKSDARRSESTSLPTRRWRKGTGIRTLGPPEKNLLAETVCPTFQHLPSERNRGFESVSLQQGVCCEPDFSARDRRFESVSLQRRVHCEPDFQQPT